MNVSNFKYTRPTLTFPRQTERSPILRCPLEVVDSIIRLVPYKDCVRLLSVCQLFHSLCITRVYRVVCIRLPEETWKIACFVDPTSSKYTHLVKTLVVLGVAERTSRGALYALAAALQKMTGLRTLMIPDPNQLSEYVHEAFEQYRISVDEVDEVTCTTFALRSHVQSS